MSVMVALVVVVGAAGAWRGAAEGEWTTRLEALRPTDPLAYFLLAEEVADDGEDVELARHLFALAAALAPESYGRSACIALADLSDDDQQQRRLLAMASLLAASSDSGGDAAAMSTRWLDPEPTTALVVGEALSFYRRGAHSRAQSRLTRGDGLWLLDAVDGALPSATSRSIFADSGRARSAPRLSLPQVAQMLEVEAALLSGRDRAWSTDLTLTRGHPLIEVDPTRMDEAMGIDARRARYRNGQWVE